MTTNTTTPTFILLLLVVLLLPFSDAFINVSLSRSACSSLCPSSQISLTHTLSL